MEWRRKERSTEGKLFAMVCLFCAVTLAHSMPSSGLEQEANRIQAPEEEADDSNPQSKWRMDWWKDPEDKTNNEEKTGEEKEKEEEERAWKVFKTDKKALKRRWWEEDWQDDQWWTSKDDSSSSSSSSKSSSSNTAQYISKKKTGESKSQPNKEKQAAAPNHLKEEAKKDAVKTPEHKALSGEESNQVKTHQVQAESVEEDIPEGNHIMIAAAAESPQERPKPVWNGEVLISPFVDPKPAPYPGPRDEGPEPRHHQWEHHQPGLGKYIDHSSSLEPLKVSKEEQQNHNEDKKDVRSKKEGIHEGSGSSKEIDEPVYRKKLMSQFYGFGLESVLSAPVNELKVAKKNPHTKTDTKTQKEKAHKSVPPVEEKKEEEEEEEEENLLEEEKFPPENYNIGVIYDVPRKHQSAEGGKANHHPETKTLIQSVKKDLSHVIEFGKEFVSTKASPQTSPNPPPPGLAKRGADVETTPLIPPRKKATPRRGKNGSPTSKSYVKSRPLTFCKLNTDCRKGRRCRRGVCVCLAEGECGGKKSVCGSDGVRYPSHCELHRTACVTRQHIKVDRKATCFTPEKTTTTTTSSTTMTTTAATTPESTTKSSTSPSLPAQSSSDDIDASNDLVDNDDDEEDDYDYEQDGGKDEQEDEYYDDEYYDDEEEEGEEEEEEERKESDEDSEDQPSTTIAPTTPTSTAPHRRTPSPEKSYEKMSETLTLLGDANNNVKKTNTRDDKSVRQLSKGDDFKSSPSVKGGKADEEEDDEMKGEDSSLGSGEDYQSDGTFFQECSSQELKRFKRQLLSFYCQRFQEPDCQLEVREEREYLSNLLFSYLDMDTDYYVSFRELRTRQASPRLPQLSELCELTDLIWNDDVEDVDGRLSLQEFSHAFADLFQARSEEGDIDDNHQEGSSKKKSPSSSSSSSSLQSSASPSSSSPSPVVNLIPTLATVGNGLELKCGLDAGGEAIVWKRHGVSIRDLDLSELLVLEDGSLFFSKMGVHHMGNYSCQNVNDPSVLQVHSLKVQMPPVVKVSPQSQIQPSRATVQMRCHAEGVPRPVLSWHMNNMDLRRNPHRYSLTGNKEQLTIYEADYQIDTGAYKCMAKNQAGTSQDLSSLFIIGDKERSVGMGFTNMDSGKFVVFHKQGYTVYDPQDCLQHHAVHGDFGYFKFIPDSLDRPLRLCEDQDHLGGPKEGGGQCSWGHVVNVRNSLLYVSQPALNRVVVIETTKNWIPVQVIATDKQPMQLHYVTHLDQVWVVCWNGDDKEGQGQGHGQGQRSRSGLDSNKTLVVVRDASKFIQHRVVHTQPVGNRFDQIQALFIAPPNDLQHTYDYGYVTHSGQQTLTKLDLDNMKYVHTIDLSPYHCVPRSLAFVPIGGHVVVECVSEVNHETLQLVLDYLTDAVVSTGLVSGRPHVSPDSRHVVTVDDLTGKVSVSGVNNEGTLEAAYEVTVSASISDVAFFPALGHGYLLVLTSADDDDIITINLSTGKVDKMKGTNRRSSSSDWYPSPVRRAIVSGDVFSDFLLAPSKSALGIMDMKYQQVKCEYPTTPHLNAAVFVRR